MVELSTLFQRLRGCSFVLGQSRCRSEIQNEYSTDDGAYLRARTAGGAAAAAGATAAIRTQWSNFPECVLVNARGSNSQYVIKQVDVSRLKQKERDEAKKEIKLLASFHHPNIVRCLGRHAPS